MQFKEQSDNAKEHAKASSLSALDPNYTFHEYDWLSAGYWDTPPFCKTFHH